MLLANKESESDTLFSSRSGEYENNKMLGETFIAACDVDQEVVKDVLDNMKERWDRLNNG